MSLSVMEWWRSTPDTAADRFRPASIGGCRISAVASVILLVVAGLAESAAAGDWSIRAGLTEKILYDDNLELVPESPGYVIGILSTPTISISNRTPTIELTIDGELNYNVYEGPGDTGELDSFDQALNVGLTKAIGGSFVRFGGGISRQAVQQSELEDTGETTGDADRISMNAGLSGSHQLTERNTVTLGANYQRADFIGETTLQPFQSFSANAGYSRRASPTTNLGLSAGITHFRPEDSGDGGEESTNSYSIDGNFSQSFSPRLSTASSAGVSFTEEDQNGSNGSDNGLTANFRLSTNISYSLERTGISFTFSQGIEPSAEGELELRRSARLNLSHRINPNLSLSLAGVFTTQQASSTTFALVEGIERTFLSISPSVRWRIAPDWTLGATYRYAQEDDEEETGIASSNSAFLSVTYGLTLEP